MNRRGFLAAILAAGVAPAVVGSGILMPVRQIVVPSFGSSWGHIDSFIDPPILWNSQELNRAFMEVYKLQWPGIKAEWNRLYNRP